MLKITENKIYTLPRLVLIELIVKWGIEKLSSNTCFDGLNCVPLNFVLKH